MEDKEGDIYMKEEQKRNGTLTATRETWKGADQTQIHRMKTQVSDQGNESSLTVVGSGSVDFPNPQTKIFDDIDLHSLEERNQIVENTTVDGKPGFKIEDSDANISLTVRKDGVVEKYFKKDADRNQSLEWIVKTDTVGNLEKPEWVNKPKENVDISG